MAETDDSRRSEIAELSRLFQERLANDPIREKAFDQLYAELKQYKEDFTFQAEKPLLLDLLLFYDSLCWFQEGLARQEMSPEVVSDSFQYLIDEFLEILYRRDINPIEPSEVFDRKIHKAVKVEDTEDPALDQKVHQVLKRGFARGERLIRPEEVVISRTVKKK